MDQSTKDVLDFLSGTDWNAVENRITGYAVEQLRKNYDDEVIYKLADELQEFLHKHLQDAEWKPVN